MYFTYGETEMNYLSKKDKRLGEAMACIGHLERPVEDDLFSSVVHQIVGQQISMKAQATIWQRMLDALGDISAETICAAEAESLQSLGLSFRKVDYIRDFAEKVRSGALDLDALYGMDDEAVVEELVKLKGIGRWTAEMLMLFCMKRPNIFSFDDLAIQRGLRMLYRHKTLDRARFERYRRRYSPYASTASLYLWAISGGAIPELTDPAAKKGAKKK